MKEVDVVIARHLNDEALADRLRRIADTPGTWSAKEKNALLYEAAKRLEKKK
jgi:hypothetical protein